MGSPTTPAPAWRLGATGVRVHVVDPAQRGCVRRLFAIIDLGRHRSIHFHNAVIASVQLRQTPTEV